MMLLFMLLYVVFCADEYQILAHTTPELTDRCRYVCVFAVVSGGGPGWNICGALSPVLGAARRSDNYLAKGYDCVCRMPYLSYMHICILIYTCNVHLCIAVECSQQCYEFV